MTMGGTRVASGNGTPDLSFIPREPPMSDPPDPDATGTYHPAPTTRTGESSPQVPNLPAGTSGMVVSWRCRGRQRTVLTANPPRLSLGDEVNHAVVFAPI